MKKHLIAILFLFVLACQTKSGESDNSKNTNEHYQHNETSSILGERIDGPANIRDKPNGEILFTLNDNVLVDVNQEENGWYRLLVYGDIESSEFEMDSMLANRSIILQKETIGKVLKSHVVSTGQNGDEIYAMLFGYTHKNNIKSESIIELRLLKHLKENTSDLKDWKSFIRLFDLRTNAVDYKKLETFYTYENSVDDPSPGFRVVLLFENKKLIGLIHSRVLTLPEMKTHKLAWSYYISFFKSYPQSEQQSFVTYMKEWIQSVD